MVIYHISDVYIMPKLCINKVTTMSYKYVEFDISYKVTGLEQNWLVCGVYIDKIINRNSYMVLVCYHFKRETYIFDLLEKEW